MNKVPITTMIKGVLQSTNFAFQNLLLEFSYKLVYTEVRIIILPKDRFKYLTVRY